MIKFRLLIALVAAFIFLKPHCAKAYEIAGINSRTDCYAKHRIQVQKTVGWGRFKEKISFYLPPPPGIYSSCLSLKASISVGENFIKARSPAGVYGNYCGTGWRGKNNQWIWDVQQSHYNARNFLGQTDELDGYCREHDLCYMARYDLSDVCDVQMKNRLCGVASRNIGKTRMTEQAGGMCATWNALVPFTVAIRGGVWAMCKLGNENACTAMSKNDQTIR